MKLQDVKTPSSFEQWMIPLSMETKIELGYGTLSKDIYGNIYNMLTNGKLIKISLRDQASSNDIDFYLKRGSAHIAEVVQTAPDGSFLLNVVFFSGTVIEIGDIEIGIDERIVSTSKKSGIRFKNIEELTTLLGDKCNFRFSGENYFIFLSGPAADTDFEEEFIGEVDSAGQNTAIEREYRQFSICGERLRVPVEKRKIDKMREVFYATKITYKDKVMPDAALRLARGSVLFTDFTKTGQIRALAAGAMNELTQESGSFLKQWDQYGSIEGEIFMKKAKAIGAIEHNGSPEKTQNGVMFFLNEPPSDFLTQDDSIELTEEMPVYVQDPEMTWDRYREYVEEKIKEYSSGSGNSQGNSSENSRSIPLEILKKSSTSIELKLDAVPSNCKYLVWSTAGERSQIERRMRARTAIIEGRSANPLLGLLIEEGGILPDVQRVSRLKPLTPFVKEKIFKNDPTEKQIEAIDIALNTPDIALIQGPPGTGKTTVITAILERLNEEYDKSKSIRGNILVSGYQHDAVENIVSRLSVNSLPTVKFGRRSSDSEFTDDVSTDRINAWCTNVSEKIRINAPQIAQTKEQLKMTELFIAYTLSPSKNNTINLIKRVLNLPRNVVTPEITSQADDILNSIQSELIQIDPISIRLIRSLRVKMSSFIDDGPERAMDILTGLESHLTERECRILTIASRWKRNQDLNFLPQLKEVKQDLLNRFNPVPDFKTEKPREDVLDLFSKVSSLLTEQLRSTNQQDAVLAEFVHELENNPEGLREAIEDYNLIFAATTQYSGSEFMARVKTKHKENAISYDTVIVDEAARTSPRDLLIPMALAEKRIVLVGDHRQLPHLIDEEVARMLEQQESSIDIGFIKKSMFEYLFNRLKKLEENDGVKRVVTLDAQYRTHPLLGDFVSNNFYNQYNEGFRSPLPVNHFNHKLKGIEGKPAVWLDVPDKLGKEIMIGTSRARSIEAIKIAKLLEEWINSEKGKGLSFGVISFYKSQVNEVFKCLKEYGITETTQDGQWQVTHKFRYLDDASERLRIGTVDSFQGMEFDVVLLSMVRSIDIENPPHWLSKEQDTHKKHQRIFGHLMSENRLCVSMSRQKKVLILVGNADLAKSNLGSDAVPALHNFYNLCRDYGVVL